MYDPYADFTKAVLPNGLEVHSVFWDRPWIGVDIVIHSGSREDPLNNSGLAHFVEHCVSDNIPGYTLDQTAQFFENVGGRYSLGSTSYLATRYRFGVPADPATFSEALRVFGSMLIQARLEKEIETERKVIYREFNQRYPFHERLEWDMAIRRSLFKGHRLETWNRPLGRPEGFLQATEADLQSFYDTHYTPDNISLVVVGGLHEHEVANLIEASPFGSVKAGKRNPIPSPFAPLPVPSEREKTVKLSDYLSLKVDQTEYKATWAFPADFPRQARRVFDQILRKILMEEVRLKRGLAYNITADWTCFHDVFEYEVNGKITPEATPYINDLVRKCIDMVPGRRDLFERKRKSLIQKCLMTDLSGSSLCDASADDLVGRQRIITLQEVWDELHEVRHEEMAEAASLLSPEQQYTFITCP